MSGEGSGNVVLAPASKPVRALSPQVAYLLTSLLQSVINNGTGAEARTRGFTLPAAGKTGTNTDFRDAWFTGFTPDLAATVWVGCDSQNFTLGQGQQRQDARPSPGQPGHAQRAQRNARSSAAQPGLPRRGAAP